MTGSPHIIGKSKHIEGVRKLVDKLAANRKDALIIGEPGVGKSTIASLIAGGEMVATIDLSTKSELEIQTTLSGLSSGVVVFERTEDAGYRVQDEVLGFIGEKTRHVRVIITLGGPTKQLVAQRKLSENLCARINGFEKIELQPLRERREDIPVLVKQFAHGLVVDINALDTLVNLPWKGNVAQLRSVVERCIASAKDGKFILPMEFVDERTEVAKMVSGLMETQRPILDKSLDAIENTIIKRTLERFGFNESKAAQFLGMTDQVFGQKLKRLATVEANSH